MYQKVLTLELLLKSGIIGHFSPIRKLHPISHIIGEPDSYLCSSNPKAIDLLKGDFKVYNNFVSESEEENLVKEVDPIFKRRRYQFDHWDGAIQGYKETEKIEWNEKNHKVLKRLQEVAFPSESILISPVHVLDLSKTGYIKPHIDSIKFCGNTIAGLSLLSSSVMRLVLERDNSVIIDALLQRRSLYIMRGIVRYEFTHEILNEASSRFNGLPVSRDRRISIICRNEPELQSKS